MILKQQTRFSVDGDDFGAVQSSIDSKDFVKLYAILSGMYKNIHESIVREYASNAWDSHKQAGCENKPILIELTTEHLKVTDYGVGMSKETLENVYFNFLNSTKENTNSFLGAFGLGSKSALSYTEVMYVQSIYEGVLRKYIFNKNSQGIPEYSMISEEETTEGNGSTITIPIKHGDVRLFSNALNTQLKYFPNVFVLDRQTPDSNYINDYRIYEGKHFLARSNNNFSETNIVLGCVSYDIDWKELGLNVSHLGVALKFDIGELPVIPNRESIEYTKDSRKLIIDRYQEVIDELTAIYEKDTKLFTNIVEYKNYMNNFSSNYRTIKLTADFSLDVRLTDIKLEQAQLEGCKHMPYSTIINNIDLDYTPFTKSLSIDGKVIHGYNVTPSASNLEYYRNFHLCLNEGEELSSRRKNMYIMEVLVNSKGINIIRKRKRSLKRYKKILTGIKKKHWREAIAAYQKYSEEYINFYAKNYSDIEIDKVWLRNKLMTNYKSPLLHRVSDLDNRPVNISVPVRGQDVNVWSSKETTIGKLRKERVIYGVKTEDPIELLALYDAFNRVYKKSKNRYTVIAISKTNAESLKDEKNMQTLQGLLEGKHRQLIRIATAHKISKIVSTWSENFRYMLRDSFRYINSDIHSMTKEIDSYQRINSMYGSRHTDKLNELVGDFVAEADLLDMNMINKALEVVKYEKYLATVRRNYKLDSIVPITSKEHYLAARRLAYIFKSDNMEINKCWYLKDEFNFVYNEIKDDKEEEN